MAKTQPIMLMPYRARKTKKPLGLCLKFGMTVVESAWEGWYCRGNCLNKAKQGRLGIEWRQEHVFALD